MVIVFLFILLLGFATGFFCMEETILPQGGNPFARGHYNLRVGLEHERSSCPLQLVEACTIHHTEIPQIP